MLKFLGFCVSASSATVTMGVIYLLSNIRENYNAAAIDVACWMIGLGMMALTVSGLMGLAYFAGQEDSEDKS